LYYLNDNQGRLGRVAKEFKPVPGNTGFPGNNVFNTRVVNERHNAMLAAHLIRGGSNFLLRTTTQPLKRDGGAHDETMQQPRLSRLSPPVAETFFLYINIARNNGTAVPPSGTTKSHAGIRGNCRPGVSVTPNRRAGVRASLPLPSVLVSLSAGTTISINDCRSWI